MLRVIILKIIVLMYTASVFANAQGSNTDLEWSDIGDSIFSIKESKRVQRKYDSIDKNEGLMTVGSFVKTSQDINLRRAVGGEKLKIILKDEKFQVLEVIVDKKGKRFYKVKSDQDFGYIYAGTKVSYSKWVKQTWSSDNKIIAEPGDLIKVKRKKGLKILKSIKDDVSFDYIPNNSEIQVKSVVQDEKGQLFYKVQYKSKTGFAKLVKAKEIAKLKFWNKIY